MSVQVRRRREAGSFLSTYVGAQGELLVDTTNNRVQVHDGVAPGGWPAAGIADLAGRNMILNGTFAINQRAYASGTALAAGAYAHDRWKAGSGGCTYTFTQAVPDTSVIITAGSLVQAVDASNVYATALWLTWTGTATARVWQGTASGAFASGTAVKVGGVQVNALPVAGLTIGTALSVEFSSGTVGLVQLEAALPNAGPTRFERRHGEMALCQRYYWAYAASGNGEYFWGLLSGTPYLGLRVAYPVTMRAVPTIVFSASSTGTFASGMPLVQNISSGAAFLRGDNTTTALTYLNSIAANAEI
ncbi:protein of unknown function [Beijerinckiaceae bacterium RH CH11]|nr:hypothetical protein [Beijerinckiaceae bacterium]VVB44041.1 protein of unknown function [Beijerinckiaceae bacterium RH CH11]VVB44068.1 protein of unknown function [Beijerinckiaceae bacterium RH AL8]